MANEVPDLPEEQLIELLTQLQKTTPDAARTILNGQPQITYALIKLMIQLNVVDPEILQTTLTSFSSGPTPATGSIAAGPTPTPAAPAYPSHSQHAPQHGQAVNGSSSQSYNHAPTAAPSGFEHLANIPDDQKAMIMRVVSMTPEQISRLPPTDRANVNQLRVTLGLPTG